MSVLSKSVLHGFKLVSAHNLCNVTCLLHQTQQRFVSKKTYDTKADKAAKNGLNFDAKRLRSNREKRLDRVKSAMKKASDTVAEHNTKYPSKPITIEDVNIDIKTPSQRRRLEMREAVQSALKSGDTTKIPVLITFLKQINSAFDMGIDNKTSEAQAEVERLRALQSDIGSRDDLVAKSIFEKRRDGEVFASDPLSQLASKTSNTAPAVGASGRRIASSIKSKIGMNPFAASVRNDSMKAGQALRNAALLDDEAETAISKAIDKQLHFLSPDLGSLGLGSRKHTSQGLFEEEFEGAGANLDDMGLTGQGGTAKSYAFNNGGAQNPRMVALISSRKARITELIAQTASSILMKRQLTGKHRTTPTGPIRLAPQEIQQLKRQLKGRGGDGALKALIKAKLKEKTPVGFVDLYELGFTITRINMSSDLAHATVLWTAPCLLPLPEADTSKIHTPTGTLLEAVIEGMTTGTRFPQHPAMVYENTKTGVAVIGENKITITTPPASLNNAEVVVDPQSELKDDALLESIDWKQQDVVYFDQETGIPLRRRPDGTITITSYGDPSLWNKRKTFQGSYVAGTIDPVDPTYVPHMQLNNGKTVDTQPNASISTKNLVSGNKVAAQRRAVNLVVDATDKYLNSITSSIRWALGERLNIKYIPNVRFEYDQQYGQITNRAKSISAALQDFYKSSDIKSDGSVDDSLRGEKMIQEAIKLRASAQALKSGVDIADVSENTLTSRIMKVKQTKLAKAAKLMRLPESELEDLDEEDLDMVLQQMEMFKRMRPLAEEDIARAQRGEMTNPDGTEFQETYVEHKYRLREEAKAAKRAATKLDSAKTAGVDIASIGAAGASSALVGDMVTRGILAMGDGHGKYSSGLSKGKAGVAASSHDDDEDDDSDSDWDDEDDEDEDYEDDDIVEVIEGSDSDDDSESGSDSGSYSSGSDSDDDHTRNTGKKSSNEEESSSDPEGRLDDDSSEWDSSDSEYSDYSDSDNDDEDHDRARL